MRLVPNVCSMLGAERAAMGRRPAWSTSNDRVRGRPDTLHTQKGGGSDGHQEAPNGINRNDEGSHFEP